MESVQDIKCGCCSRVTTGRCKEPGTQELHCMRSALSAAAKVQPNVVHAMVINDDERVVAYVLRDGTSALRPVPVAELYS